MASTYQNIQFRVDDRVARITFARPPLNVFNIEMMREISSALGECAQRDLVAIVFDADKTCRAFSAGVSVEEHAQETIFQMLDAFHSIFRLVEQLAKPTIALVDGAALGGGCELVAACDIVIASDRSPSRPCSGACPSSGATRRAMSNGIATPAIAARSPCP